MSVDFYLHLRQHEFLCCIMGFKYCFERVLGFFIASKIADTCTSNIVEKWIPEPIKTLCLRQSQSSGFGYTPGMHRGGGITKSKNPVANECKPFCSNIAACTICTAHLLDMRMPFFYSNISTPQQKV